MTVNQPCEFQRFVTTQVDEGKLKYNCVFYNQSKVALVYTQWCLVSNVDTATYKRSKLYFLFAAQIAPVVAWPIWIAFAEQLEQSGKQ